MLEAEIALYELLFAKQSSMTKTTYKKKVFNLELINSESLEVMTGEQRCEGRDS